MTTLISDWPHLESEPESGDEEKAALKAELIQAALGEGFESARLTVPERVEDAGRRLLAQLAKGYHGEMAWLAERADQRADPRALWAQCRSVLMVAMNYGPADDPMERLKHRDHANISVYAQGQDYHDVLKKRLKRLGRWWSERTGRPLKVFVDTAPVMEKPLAQAAGIGWQGKHTNLLSREHGSWLFLGAMYLDIDLAPDEPETDHCGSCRACLDICPTHAFPAPYQLDARRCLSYLTIEYKGPWPEEFRRAIGNRVYGCDDCLAICPWNKFAERAREHAFHPRAELMHPRLADLAALDDAGFREVFSGSPIKRIGRERLVRNVLYAIGASGDVTLRPAAARLTEDASPVVADAARWALEELDEKPCGG
jgi:epoxyqueuosine reductase